MATAMDETEEKNLEFEPPETPKTVENEDSESLDRAPPGMEPPAELLASLKQKAGGEAEIEAEIKTEAEVGPEAGAEPGETLEIDDALPPMPEVPQFSHELTEEERGTLKRVLMAMLFASTEPLSASRLSEAAGLSVAPIKELLQELREDSLGPGAVFELKKHGDGWRLYTKEEFYPYLVRLRSLKRVERLTPAALETLAIIAYRQPVIRAEVEAIRGVKVGPMLRALLDRKLVSIVGRAPVPGAPFQYGTTKTFLERFGLGSLADLPSLKEFQQGRI